MTKGLLFVALDPIKKGSDPAIKAIQAAREWNRPRYKETESLTNSFHADGQEKEGPSHELISSRSKKMRTERRETKRKKRRGKAESWEEEEKGRRKLGWKRRGKEESWEEEEKERRKLG